MRTVAVVPVAPRREDNLLQCLISLADQTEALEGVVLVYDGPEAYTHEVQSDRLPVVSVVLPKKHEPGMEQPRNVGVRYAGETFPDADHVWFVDSDIIFREDALEAYTNTVRHTGGGRILIGPYDWLAPHMRSIPEGDEDGAVLDMPDPRWAMFREHAPSDIFAGSLGVALGCFSGNLVWPIERFKEIGGFWSEIHHGRCEDGELGLRASSLGVPMSLVARARGWHLWHERNMDWALKANARDVPMLNARHPWVEQQGLIVTKEDGARFNAKCPNCGENFNTLFMWQHAEECSG